MATEHWGARLKDPEDGKLLFHSDYSNLVYGGELYNLGQAERPVFTGENAVGISAAQKDANGQGWITQYKMDVESDYFVPFYRPAYSGQKIGIMDVINQGDGWVVNLIYDGSSSQKPRVFGFIPLVRYRAVSRRAYGMELKDEDGNTQYTDGIYPLRIDEVIPITHPSIIREAGRGAFTGSTFINSYAPDQVNTVNSQKPSWDSTLFHAVPNAYGGLAYQYSASGTQGCGWFRKEPWAIGYQSWCSYRGVFQHYRLNNTHKATYLSDFQGAMYKKVTGSCGWSGFLGVVFGGIGAAIGGLSLGIGAALVGFAIPLFNKNTIPTLAAYENDEYVDTAGTVQLITTDAGYYDILAYDEYNVHWRCGGLPFEDGTDYKYDGVDYIWYTHYIERLVTQVSYYYSIPMVDDPSNTYAPAADRYYTPYGGYTDNEYLVSIGYDVYDESRQFYFQAKGYDPVFNAWMEQIEAWGYPQEGTFEYFYRWSPTIMLYGTRSYYGNEFPQRDFRDGVSMGTEPPPDLTYVVYDGEMLFLDNGDLGDQGYNQDHEFRSITYSINLCQYTFQRPYLWEESESWYISIGGLSFVQPETAFFNARVWDTNGWTAYERERKYAVSRTRIHL